MGGRGAVGDHEGNRPHGGLAGALLASSRCQAQGRAGGWAEGSRPTFALNARHRAITGLAGGLCALVSASASRPSSVLFRTPGSTQCPGHTKGFKLG